MFDCPAFPASVPWETLKLSVCSVRGTVQEEQALPRAAIRLAQRTADGQCQAALSQARPTPDMGEGVGGAGNPAIPTADSSEFILNYTDSSAASPVLLWGGLRPPQGLGIMPWALLSSACHLLFFDLYFLCIYCSNFEFLPS